MARCTVIKVPHPKRRGSPVLLLQNYSQIRFMFLILFEGKVEGEIVVMFLGLVKGSWEVIRASVLYTSGWYSTVRIGCILDHFIPELSNSPMGSSNLGGGASLTTSCLNFLSPP